MFLIRKNKISNVNMKRYVEIGSPWQTALSKLKYWGVDQPFATHEN